MKLFNCACGSIVFFESRSCLACGRRLAFVPETRAVAPLEPGSGLRPCRNETDHGICSWAIGPGDRDPLCVSCRLNQSIPDLRDPDALAAWEALEVAKRRMLYTLLELGLPIDGGLAFAFPASRADGKVLTGHANGLITIALDEADDPWRERIRHQMGEAYRTLLGHFRHEIGHYYWDRLIRDTPQLAAFRALFGDETADYPQALERHYADGPPGDWQERFVSAYATMHPWEDWAESWAHYLHMVDTTDTAKSYGLVVAQQPPDGAPPPAIHTPHTDFSDFDSLITSWLPLTVALNSLNRSMGHVDLYPFVLSDSALAKLRFVHDVIAGITCCV